MSRKAKESPEDRPNKRQCVAGAPMSRAPAVIKFDDINDDVLVNIMSFLKTEELNDATLINSRLCEARNHPSLDQTRTATIVITSENMTILDLYETIASRGWTRVFADNSNKSGLRILGLERLQGLQSYVSNDLLREQAAPSQLPSVTCLDLSSSHNEQHRAEVYPLDISSVACLLPNLRQVDLSYVQTQGAVFTAMSDVCGRNLASIKWNGAERACLIPPLFAARHATDLTELHLNDGRISGYGYSQEERDMLFSTDPSDQERYLWWHCSRLERLSMKNTTWDLINSVRSPPQPFSQDMLIKLVRLHPTLRWLRSDLTDENMAMLRVERPEVTLVNE